MSSFEDELKETFLVEAQDMLDDAEACFIGMCEHDPTADELAKVFRLAHSFKGSASAVGFNQVAGFAHKMEDVLSKVQKKQLEYTQELSFLMIKANDGLKKMILGLKTDFNYIEDVADILIELNSFLEKKEGSNISSASSLSGSEQAIISDHQPLSPRADHGGYKEDNSIKTEKDHEKVESIRKSEPKSEPKNSENKTVEQKRKKEFIRVDTEKLDNLVNYVGELVVSQSILKNLRLNDGLNSTEAKRLLNDIEKNVANIRDLSLSLRLVPLESVFQKLTKIIKESAFELKKAVHLEIEGGDVELDKTVVDAMGDPLVHLVRNAIDHGLENAEERLQSGKTEKGLIKLIATQREDRVEISIKDDGRGIQKEKVLAKAKTQGLWDGEKVLSDQEVYSFIFRSGFSTKEAVTNLSGRGVGMDVVSQTITELKGQISLLSEPLKGSVFTISLPLSLSIIKGMVVSSAGEKFVVPVSQMIEAIDIRKFEIHKMTDHAHMINLRDEVIPVHALELLMTKNKPKSQPLNGIVVSFQSKKACLLVDKIIGQQEIVIKSLGDKMKGLPGVIGGAILGNGEPSLILDLSKLVEMRINHAA
jgi:two-component system chemotaxis sensor kinase CheA